MSVFLFLLPAPSICCRPLTSPSTPALRFHFLSPRLHFLSFLPFYFLSFPYGCKWWLHMHACTLTCTKHIDEWKWLKVEIYTCCTWTDIVVEPAHTLSVFCDWSYGLPSGLKWKPIKLNIFHFHLHQARRTCGCYGCSDTRTFTETWFSPPHFFLK